MKISVCIFLAAVAYAAKPVQTVTLKSSQLEVTFDPLKGLPTEYRFILQQGNDSWGRRQRRGSHDLSSEATDIYQLRGSSGSDQVQQDARRFSV